VVGTLLVVLVLSQLILGVLAATGIPIAWEKGVLGGTLGMGLVLVGTGLGLLVQSGFRRWRQNQSVFSRKTLPRGSNESLWNKGIVGVIAWGLPISAGLGVAGGSRLFSTVAPNLLTSAMLTGIVGLCGGVYAGVVHGQGEVRDYLPVFVFILIFVGFNQIQELGILAGGLETIVMAGSLIVTLNLGMWWTTRQVPDKLVRQQLANPEEDAASE
jgi:hypothetical protein